MTNISTEQLDQEHLSKMHEYQRKLRAKYTVEQCVAIIQLKYDHIPPECAIALAHAMHSMGFNSGYMRTVKPITMNGYQVEAIINAVKDAEQCKGVL